MDWDDTEGVLKITISDNGCHGCMSGNEVVTVALEQNPDETKKRVKVTSVGECYCMHDDDNFILRSFSSWLDDYGYPEGAVEENKFEIVTSQLD